LLNNPNQNARVQWQEPFVPFIVYFRPLKGIPIAPPSMQINRGEVKKKTCEIINLGDESFAGEVSESLGICVCGTVSPGHFCLRVNKISAPPLGCCLLHILCI